MAFLIFSFLTATAAVLLLPTCFALWFSIIYIKESFLNKEKLHPIAGTIFNQLMNFNTYFDFLSSLFRKNPTFRFLSLTSAQIYAADPTNVEYILKTNFTNYGKNKKEDILSRFLIASEQDHEKMTDQYLRDIILNFMIAGKDTTAGTLTRFFYMLCKNPLVQEKITKEVREAVNNHEDRSLVNNFAESLTETALDKMQYLHAALTETLRLYPAVPVEGKGTESDDVWPDGFKVRKGDFVSYVPYAMGRMTYIWGEDAEDFRPERWLENGVFRAETPFKFTAFQAGPRICLGKEFAYRQMKIIAALLLHLFKFKLSEEGKEAKYRTMFTLHMDQGLHLLAFHRSI